MCAPEIDGSQTVTMQEALPEPEAVEVEASNTVAMQDALPEFVEYEIG